MPLPFSAAFRASLNTLVIYTDRGNLWTAEDLDIQRVDHVLAAQAACALAQSRVTLPGRVVASERG